MKIISLRRTRNLLFVALFVGSREAMASPSLPLAQADLRNGMEAGLGILFLFGFVWGVIKIWNGADKMSKGDADGKMGIISGIIIAAAAVIMGALFTIFGMGDGVLTPTFN